MAKQNIPTALQDHLDSGATTMCICWRVTRKDGVVMGFTNHDGDLTFDGTTFEAEAGFTASMAQQALGLSVDNMEVVGAFNSNFITETDLISGVYDDADIEVYLVNWQDTAQRSTEMFGSIGEVTQKGIEFTAELRSLTHRLNQKIGRVYSRDSDALDCAGLDDFIVAGKVAANQGTFIETNKTLVDGRFDGGTVRFYDAANTVVNEKGLMVNAYHTVAGRGDYFHPSSGTSEAQFLGVYAHAYAASVLTNTTKTDALFVARIMASSIETTLYRGELDTIADNVFVPHWLFNVKEPFLLQQDELAYNAAFTDIGGGQARAIINLNNIDDVYSVRSSSSTLVWDNVFSDVVGDSYTIDTKMITDTSATITINGPAGNHLCALVHDNGKTLTVNQPYEAWPFWRQLEATEVDCAADTLRWALDAYNMLSKVDSTANWAAYANKTKATIEYVFDVDDGKSYFRPSLADNASALSATFTYTDKGVKWGRDDTTAGLKAVVTEGAGEVQIGRGVGDDQNSSNSIFVDLSVSINTNNVWLFVDTSSSYSPTTRYFYRLNHVSGRKTYTIPFSSFYQRDGDGVSTLSGAFTVETVGISNVETDFHTIILVSMRPLPVVSIDYAPYVCPFTANKLNGDIISWRGVPGTGYQSPDIWPLVGGTNAIAGAEGQIQFLLDAQAHHTANTANTESGPLAHAYVWARQNDNDLTGAPGDWLYTWHDPNSRWGGYQYRPIEGTAKFYYENKNDSDYTTARNNAASLVLLFMQFIDSVWATNGPPTDFYETGAQTLYEEPHFAALLLRAALYMKGGGATSIVYDSIINKAWTFLETKYANALNYPDMAGTWSTDPANINYFGFWHCEIIITLCVMHDLASHHSKSNVNDRLVNAVTWTKTHVRKDVFPGVYDVKQNGVNDFYLWHSLNVPVGTNFEIRPTCPKTAKRHKELFGDLTDFRGFPHMPGKDIITVYAEQGGENQDGGALVF